MTAQIQLGQIERELDSDKNRNKNTDIETTTE